MEWDPYAVLDVDFERFLDAGPTQVPVMQRVIAVQEVHQSRNIHVVVIIEVTEPPARNKNCMCK